MNIKATVIIPTFDHGPLIEYSLESVKNQTMKEIEIFVIGDGAPEQTRQIIGNHARLDPRIKYFEFSKDTRHGEIYRDQIIREHARGEIVCYLCDDDLWLPNHLEVMYDLLSDADFAHTLPVLNYPDLGWVVNLCDLSLPHYRAFILNQQNLFPFSSVGHTRDMYYKLPYGWRTTPKGISTDHYMHQQILSQPWVRAKSSFKPTYMHFPSSLRRDWTAQMRDSELMKFCEVMQSHAGVKQWHDDMIYWIAQAAIVNAESKTELDAIKNTKTWKLRLTLLRWLAILPMKIVKT